MEANRRLVDPALRRHPEPERRPRAPSLRQVPMYGTRSTQCQRHPDTATDTADQDASPLPRNAGASQACDDLAGHSVDDSGGQGNVGLGTLEAEHTESEAATEAAEASTLLRTEACDGAGDDVASTEDVRSCVPRGRIPPASRCSVIKRSSRRRSTTRMPGTSSNRATRRSATPIRSPHQRHHLRFHQGMAQPTRAPVRGPAAVRRQVRGSLPTVARAVAATWTADEVAPYAARRERGAELEWHHDDGGLLRGISPLHGG